MNWRAHTPMLLVLCGLSAAGKSHLARRIARDSGFPVLSSDATRKRLAGADREAKLDDSYYSSQFDRRTYAELGSEARAALEDGGGVLVDATFQRRDQRATFLDALGDAAPAPLFVELWAPRETLAERIRNRSDRESDASVEVLARQSFEPLDEVPETRRVRLSSDRSPDSVAADIEAWLEARRAGESRQAVGGDSRGAER